MKGAARAVLRASVGVLVVVLSAALLATPVFALESEQESSSPMGTTAITVQVMPSSTVLSNDSEPPALASDENYALTAQKEDAGPVTRELPESSSGDSNSRRRSSGAAPLKTGDSFAALALGAGMCAFLGAAALVETFRRRHDVEEDSHRRIGGESTR